jgi:hypothetical protein
MSYHIYSFLSQFVFVTKVITFALADLELVILFHQPLKQLGLHEYTILRLAILSITLFKFIYQFC